MNQFEFSSELTTPADVVWNHATSPAGVNLELRPFLRMTFPSDISNLAESAKLNENLFRSWLLLGGLIPVEFDDVVFAEIEPGRRFLERSSMLTQALWEHERIVEPTTTGCCVTDRVRYEPRLRLLGVMVRPIFVFVFKWRHRNLRRLFGTT